MSKYLDRIRDERGSVGVLLALVIFTVVGMLFMTFNTAQLSKEKMRLQNAADAAALEHAIWQARAMNALQNLNDEGYVTCQTAQVFLTVAAGIEAAAKVVRLIPVAGPILASALRVFAVMAGGMSSVMSNIVVKFAIPIFSFFYARIAVPIGYFSAQQYAYANGATAIFGSIGILKGKLFGDMKLGLYAAGISPASPVTTFVLPVRRCSMGKSPYKYDSPAKRLIFRTTVGVFGAIYKAMRIGAPWDFQPWVSKGGPYDDGSDDSAKSSSSSSSSKKAASADAQNEEKINRWIEARRKLTLEKRVEEKKIEREIIEVNKLKEAAKAANRKMTKNEKGRYDAAYKWKDTFMELISKKEIELTGNVNSPEWYARTRALACDELKIKDPKQKNKPPAAGKGKKTAGKSSGGKSGGKGAQLPGATIWIAFKAKNAIHTLPIDSWTPDHSKSGLNNCPIIAIAAAKCITGDLIPHNKKSKKGKVNQRPSGFGTGAAAKLVPVQRALSEFSNETAASIVSKLVGTVIYH